MKKKTEPMPPSLSRSITQQAKSLKADAATAAKKPQALPKPGDTVEWWHSEEGHPARCRTAIVVKNGMSPGGMNGYVHIHCPIFGPADTMFPVPLKEVKMREWQEVSIEEFFEYLHTRGHYGH